MNKYLTDNPKFLDSIGDFTARLLNGGEVFDGFVDTLFDAGKAILMWAHSIADSWFIGNEEAAKLLREGVDSLASARKEWNASLNSIKKNTGDSAELARKELAKSRKDDAEKMGTVFENAVVTLIPLLDDISRNTRDTAEKNMDVFIPAPDGGRPRTWNDK
jgi:hypothetical protein